MYRILVAFLVTFICCISASAQNILSFIPKTAKSVTVVKGNRLDETYHLKEVTKQENYQDFEEKFQDDSEDYWYGFNVISRYNGLKMGVNNLATYYSFQENNDSLRIKTSIFEVSSKSELDKFIEEAVGEDVWKEKANSGAFEYLVNDEYALAWNKQFFIFYSGRVMYGYVNSLMQEESDYYLEELSEKERNERDVQRDKIKEDLVKKDLLRLLSLNFEDAILSERQFMDLLSKDYDSFIYSKDTFKQFGGRKRNAYNNYDYDRYAVERAYEMDVEEPEPNPLLEGNYSYNFWKFDAETLTSQSHLSLNPDLFKYFKKLATGRFNKDYRKYISSDEVMGYYSLAVNPKHTVQFLQAMSVDFMNYVPGVRGASQNIMSLLGAIINKKKALKILNGDALFVITDLKEVDVRYESFSYNKEDQVRERIIKTKKEKRPEFIFMTTSNYPEFVQKALDLLEKEYRLVKMGDYYRLSSQRSKYDTYGYDRDVKEGSVDTYLAFVDGILMITNNEKTVSEYLDKGYPKEKQLSKDAFVKMTDDDMNVYWDIEGINNSGASDQLNTMPSLARGLLQVYDNMFDQFEMNGLELEDNVATFNAEYQLKKEDRDLSTLFLLDMLTGLSNGPGGVFSEERY